MKFTEGEEVLAKHPNTSEYHKGRILNVRGNRYKIQFETGVEHTVSESDIKPERVTRTATRASTRISRKSPSRYSPGGKSSSRRSPSRRSPSRRSPGRQATNAARQLPVRSARLAKISLSRIDVKDEKLINHQGHMERTEGDSPIETIPLQYRLKEIYDGTRRSSRFLSGTEYSVPSRAFSVPTEKGYNYSLKERGYSMQRDQNLKSQERVIPLVAKREKEIINAEEQEWGGWIGAFLLILILPLSILLPQLLCSKGQCKITHIKLPTDLKSYVNWHGFLSYVVFLVILACLSIIPIGKKVDGQQSKIGKLQYRVNGFLSAILAFAVLCFCVMKKIPIVDYILNNAVQLAVSGWLVGMISALGLYIKAERAPVTNLNIYASTNSKIYNFWQGKEINPRIGVLDIKILLRRASFVGMLIVNTAVGIKALDNRKEFNIEQLDIPILLALTMQLFYIIDELLYEDTIFTSFAIMYEGTGYMTCVSHLLYPFLPTLVTRFILYQKTQFNYFIGIFVLTFLMGYVLYRKSNSRKDEFRKNPILRRIPYMETIPTSRGKKLMVSGLWNHVRHPNYLGDIIMQWSCACISLTTDILPYYAAICCTLTLAYRAIRDNRRCQTRYGYAWEQYCARVKYKILKCVF